MAKRKRRPSRPPTLPTHGDTGPDTAAQMAGTVILEERAAGVRFLKKRRDHVLEWMARDRHRNGRAKQSEISPRQLASGMTLFEAFCETGRSAESAFSRPFVESTPDYEASVLLKAERSHRFGALYRTIPSALRSAVDHIVLGDRWPSDKSQLACVKVALDLLANEIGGGK